MLTSTLKVFPKYPDLKGAIKPSNIPDADWFETISTDNAQFLHIKPGQDGSLICKFEEAPAYRNALLRSGVYYVGFRLTNLENDELADWITAWRKESGHWRLISIGLMED